MVPAGGWSVGLSKVKATDPCPVLLATGGSTEPPDLGGSGCRGSGGARPRASLKLVVESWPTLRKLGESTRGVIRSAVELAVADGRRTVLRRREADGRASGRARRRGRRGRGQKGRGKDGGGGWTSARPPKVTRSNFANSESRASFSFFGENTRLRLSSFLMDWSATVYPETEIITEIALTVTTRVCRTQAT